MITLASLLAATLAASGPTPVGQVAEERCELHIFGWLPGKPPTIGGENSVGNALVRAVPISGDPAAPGNLLNAAVRLSEVGDQPVKAALALPGGYTVVRHLPFYSDLSPFKVKGRVAQTGSPCHDELVVQGVAFLPASRALVGKDLVQFRYAYRRFDPSRESVVSGHVVVETDVEAILMLAGNGQQVALAQLSGMMMEAIGVAARRKIERSRKR